jgi:hypothetical protein
MPTFDESDDSLRITSVEVEVECRISRFKDGGSFHLDSLLRFVD